MSQQHPAWPWPAFIAHRGGGHFAPENTLAAMRTGAAKGFRMVEYDVKLSQDGVPFLLHDDTVDRTSDGRGAACDLTWAALAQIDFGDGFDRRFAGEPAATLFSVARCTRALGVASNIEIKPSPQASTATGTAVAHAAARLWHGATLPPLLSSFSEAALEAARAAVPDLPRALLMEGPPPADWHAHVRALDCIGINLDAQHVDQELVREVRDRGIALAVWTVNDPARARELLGWGCDAIFTDALDTVRDAATGMEA